VVEVVVVVCVCVCGGGGGWMQGNDLRLLVLYIKSLVREINLNQSMNARTR
jgi:hypothetical protein